MKNISGGGKGKGGGSVFISGGEVTAFCYADIINSDPPESGSGAGKTYRESGAAIGGGFEGNGGTIVITGGNVKAYANTPHAKGLGGGDDCKSGGDITITDGTVFASAEIENKWSYIWYNYAVCNKKQISS